MDLLLKNGLIVTDGLEMLADLAVMDGRIMAIGNLGHLQADQVIDCSDKVILPGCVDLGLNLMDGGFNDPESTTSLFHATRDAAEGGVTTVVSTFHLEEDDDPRQVIEAQVAADSGKACVDFAYHLLLDDWNAKRRDQTKLATEQGIISFWLSRTERESKLPYTALLAAVFQELPQEALAIVQPYDPVLCQYYREQGQEEFPDFLEATTISTIGALSEKSRCWVVMNGISSALGIQALSRVRERSPRLVPSLLASHLLWSQDIPGAPKLWPPARRKMNQNMLFQSLENGAIPLLSSGHKPRLETEREENSNILGTCSYSRYLHLLLSEGVGKARFNLGTLSQFACADPAKMAGLYPTKGTIQTGSDADLVIWNPAGKTDPNDSTADYPDPLRAMTWQGCIDTVFLRGKCVLKEGRYLGDPIGQFQKRELALR